MSRCGPPAADDATRRRWRRRVAATTALLLMATSGARATAGEEPVAAPAAPPPAAVARAPATAGTSAPPALERRVRALTQLLELDAAQQVELRSLLLRQRAEVTRIWNDPKLMPAERGPATRAAADRTADGIRAMLTEEQRKKYNPAAPAAGTRPGEEPPNVAELMQKIQSKRP